MEMNTRRLLCIHPENIKALSLDIHSGFVALLLFFIFPLRDRLPHLLFPVFSSTVTCSPFFSSTLTCPSSATMPFLPTSFSRRLLSPRPHSFTLTFSHVLSLFFFLNRLYIYCNSVETVPMLAKHSASSNSQSLRLQSEGPHSFSAIIITA